MASLVGSGRVAIHGCLLWKTSVGGRRAVSESACRVLGGLRFIQHSGRPTARIPGRTPPRSANGAIAAQFAGPCRRSVASSWAGSGDVRLRYVVIHTDGSGDVVDRSHAAADVPVGQRRVPWGGLPAPRVRAALPQAGPRLPGDDRESAGVRGRAHRAGQRGRWRRRPDVGRDGIADRSRRPARRRALRSSSRWAPDG